LTAGNVTFTATWTQKNITATKQITIATPENDTLEINADDTYTTADTPTLTAVAKKNGTADSTATITWASSDTNVATIDSTGKVTFLKAGSVTFTATWTQKNITANKTVTVAVPVATLTATITNNQNAPSGSVTVNSFDNTVFTGHFWKGSTEVTNITPVWTFTPPTGKGKEFDHTENGMEYTIKLNTVDFDIDGKYCTLKLEDSNHTTSVTENIKIYFNF